MNHGGGERATSNRWLVESVHCRIRRGKPWSGRAKKNPLRTKPWKKHPCFVPFPSWTRWERRQGSAINSLRSPLTPPPARGGGGVQGYVLDKADDIIDAPAGDLCANRAGPHCPSDGTLGRLLCLDGEGLTRLRLQFHLQRLGDQVQNGSSIVDEKPDPLPLLHLGEIDSTERQTADQVDEAIPKTLRLQPPYGGCIRRWIIGRLPGLSYLFLGLLCRNPQGREVHRERLELQPMSWAR